MPVSSNFATPRSTVAELRAANAGDYTSQAWKRLSRYIRTKYPICQYCENALSQSGDHINGDSKDNRSCNIAATCNECHNTKTHIFEAKGRHARIHTLYELYQAMPLTSPIECKVYSPHSYVAGLIGRLHSTIIDLSAVASRFLDEPTDANILFVCTALNIPVDCALNFTLVRNTIRRQE